MNSTDTLYFVKTDEYNDHILIELMTYLLTFLQTSYKVDPTIIGGMVVSIGDKFADMSIASKMKKYTELIQAAA